MMVIVFLLTRVCKDKEEIEVYLAPLVWMATMVQTDKEDHQVLCMCVCVCICCAHLCASVYVCVCVCVCVHLWYVCVTASIFSNAGQNNIVVQYVFFSTMSPSSK